MASRKVGHEVAAAKGEALTLDDYAQFVEDCRRLGIRGDAVPTAKIRFSGKVHALTVKNNSERTEPDAT